MKPLTLAIFTALLTLAACERAPESSAVTPLAAQQSFNLADGNKDGLVSANELGQIIVEREEEQPQDSGPEATPSGERRAQGEGA